MEAATRCHNQALVADPLPVDEHNLTIVRINLYDLCVAPFIDSQPRRNVAALPIESFIAARQIVVCHGRGRVRGEGLGR